MAVAGWRSACSGAGMAGGPAGIAMRSGRRTRGSGRVRVDGRGREALQRARRPPRSALLVRRGLTEPQGRLPDDWEANWMRQSEHELRRLLDQRVVVLDGSWGVLLQGKGLTPADYRGDRFGDHSHDVTGDPDVLNITRPDVIADIHREYFAAGADITTTNTFTATSIGQADYGLGDYVREMNIA